ncbi:unnamed protein product [[Actinomadura] parvosata subsp. kistnae]|nr:unnamed protein product [Actinomadura parvosata subsp. kistnae]
MQPAPGGGGGAHCHAPILIYPLTGSRVAGKPICVRIRP